MMFWMLQDKCTRNSRSDPAPQSLWMTHNQRADTATFQELKKLISCPKSNPVTRTRWDQYRCTIQFQIRPACHQQQRTSRTGPWGWQSWWSGDCGTLTVLQAAACWGATVCWARHWLIAKAASKWMTVSKSVDSWFLTMQLCALVTISFHLFL